VRPLIDAVPAFSRICAAVEAARHTVWVAVTFLWPEFQMPDERGTIFDVLDNAVARGVDVRLLIWRPDPETQGLGRDFPGSPANRELLHARDSRFRIRWDRAHPGFCQHQKCWLIDAGEDDETAFVGGINLTAPVPNIPGHAGDGQIHDVYVEIAGPSATDVHHNFVQRWNEASERIADDGAWATDGFDDNLAFPSRLSPPKGSSRAQLQRNIHPGRYTDSTPTPGGSPYPLAQGERSIVEQYLLAINAARSTIYIENQAIPIPLVASRLEAALERGVEVAVLAPSVPERSVQAARHDPARQDLFDRLAALGRHESFTLAGLAGSSHQGGRRDVYVHDKVMIVDDCWATIGSCNLHAHSLGGNSELNASIWDPNVARAFRRDLLLEHLDIDTTQMTDRTALRLFQSLARENRRKREVGKSDWQGLAFRIDPATYGA
jgi:phosphatidylserine/phosphatidylglycerophosphate/cardiolipin synthase-like enzyme